MVWVRSEYAGELAVLSTWFSALIPWNVFLGSVAGGSIVLVRFPLLEVQYAFGVPLARGTSVRDPVSAYQLQAGQTVASAYAAWLVGAALLLAAIAVSVYYYRAEERAEAWSVDPVSVLGALLAVCGVVFAVASLLLTGGFLGVDLGVGGGLDGISIPVGVVFYLTFGALLLRAEQVG
ncbi:hypothetical protein HUG10_02505 [Halorarum halophilum]|uniref:TIGR04206 family protein n=1 Tax=Halorarum halophilum TaxID=2743090 RepID=A0A7D5K675_9EURY|nr:hypothetical protein [Halobaculum halophilum]QLG26479.1 hypothetical protein HUG10_02505 [Halobaculum halophilum]